MNKRFVFPVEVFYEFVDNLYLAVPPGGRGINDMKQDIRLF